MVPDTLCVLPPGEGGAGQSPDTIIMSTIIEMSGIMGKRHLRVSTIWGILKNEMSKNRDLNFQKCP